MIADAGHGAGDGDRRQTGAFTEGISVDARHAAGYLIARGVFVARILDECRLFFIKQHTVLAAVFRVAGIHTDFRQFPATIEGIIADARHAGRDGDGCQARVRKGIIADGRHAVADGDRSQIAATIEGMIADGRHFIGDDNGCQATAIIEGITADARHIVGDGDRSQLAAIIEGRIADTRHAVGDGDRIQLAAISEGRIADARHAAGDGDRLQIAATTEGIIADARHTILDNDARNAVTIVYPGLVTTTCIIRHGARAADGHHAVVGQCPFDFWFMSACAAVAAGNNAGPCAGYRQAEQRENRK